LANYDAIVLDIGQADIHDTLSLGILFEIQSGPFLKFIV
jgi:phosphoserine phosphatase